MSEKDPEGKAVPFSIQVCTADRSRNKGGDRIIAPKAWLASKEGFESSGSKSNNSAPASPKVGHSKKHTRLIFIEGKDHPISINCRLVEIFNGQEVVY